MTELDTIPTRPGAAEVPSADGSVELAVAKAPAVQAVQAVDMSAVVNRVKRAQGQLGGVLRMIEEGRDLEAVIHQLKAVSRALDRAGFALIAAELRQNIADGADVGEPELAKLEKFFLSLA